VAVPKSKVCLKRKISRYWETKKCDGIKIYSIARVLNKFPTVAALLSA
jgi:hypothetical protein